MRKNSPVIFYYSNETNMKHHNENIVVLASDEKIANRKVQKHSQNQSASGNKCLFVSFVYFNNQCLNKKISYGQKHFWPYLK